MIQEPEQKNGLTLWGAWITFFAVLNSGYLLAFADANLFYMANVLVHLALGAILLFVWGLLCLQILTNSAFKSFSALPWSTVLFILLAAGTGILLVILGNLRPQRMILWTHIIASLGAVSSTVIWWQKRAVLKKIPFVVDFIKIAIGIAVVLFVIVQVKERWFPNPRSVISNPARPPFVMEEEAMGGAEGPFFPSAAATAHGGLIPVKFFMNSESCGQAGCHPDITQQWQSSAHRFASFNNQWYRKSIEYMQAIVGLEAPQWCAGCHDPALLFSGQMKQPVSDFIDQPEAHAGLGCVMCHSIVEVKDTMGNAGYVLEYPELNDLATSENVVIRFLHDFLVRLDPGPHKKLFMKPFHRQQTAEFCSSCHKVHLDKVVNNYRWIRGFNEYDNWQASGVSGFGARSFYYPPAPQTCTTCHMQLTPSDDAGNIDGFVHDHRFIGANTALPVANQDSVQLQLTQLFLKSNQVTVDIFAMSKPGRKARLTESSPSPTHPGRPQLASTFAVGEEQGMTVGGGSITRKAVDVAAPLESGAGALRRGDSVRLDVVVRTRGVGHFFPGGTVDAQEVWLEVKAVDNKGQTIFWSGRVADDGEGPVDPGAHFYRSVLLDAHGNRINKRNAWAARSVLYVNLIPPGAADVAHYRLNIPENCGDEILITAKLHYRKFDWWHTHFAYAGVRDPRQPNFVVTKDYDDGNWVFSGDTRNVSGALKEVPVLPIVTMAVDSVRLPVTSVHDELPKAAANVALRGRERWNDYGIALFREGDLKGAQQAFQKVTNLEPSYVDGWVNLARAYLREGLLPQAKTALDSAEKTHPGFHKTHYFRGLLHKASGEYMKALSDLQIVADLFPKDRVVLNQIGRVYYLNAQPELAIPYFQRTLAIDAEDLMAHYNLALCYRATGREKDSNAHEVLYKRYKEDETSKAIAQTYRRKHPHDNNESQPIHEHLSSHFTDY